jgi:hypothetical protein
VHGYKKGTYALNERFSYHAPSERRIGAAGKNRFAIECPGAGGLCAGSRVREPAPGKATTFPGKPRNPDERLHPHVNLPCPIGPTFQPRRYVIPPIKASRMR